MRHSRPLSAAAAVALSATAALTAFTTHVPQNTTPLAAQALNGQTTPTPATTVAKSNGGPVLDEENTVSGTAAQDIPVDGVAADAIDDAPTASKGEEVAALTSAERTETFQALGVTWDKDTDEQVESVKVRLRENGEWTEWNDLLLIADRVESESDRTGTDPILTNGADGYQVEVITASGNQPSGLEVNLINPGVGSLDDQVVDKAQEIAETPRGAKAAAVIDPATGQAPAEQTATLSAASVSSLRPTIVTRASWGADESVTYDAPQNTKLSAMYLHHTASSNNYTKEQAAAQVRSIHYYQAVTLEWGDIGYHFLVDKFGTIYEGARGSIESLPRGAHALGFNTNTIGVSALGQYGDVPPSSAMLDSIARVFAWKAAQHDLNPTSKTTLTSQGNSKNSWGTKVSTDVILGHYYTNATACPGQYLVAKLPEIRANAAKLVNGTGAPDPTSPPSGYTSGSYTVQAGDGWSTIANKTGVSMNTLLTLNKATISTMLHPGMVLKTGTTSTASPTPTDPSGSSSTYTVRANDGWWLIAQRTGVSQKDLQALNGMTASTVLHPGMVLKTSASTASPTPSTGTGSYTVQANDGWWLISKRTGVPVSTLQSLNGMNSRTILHPGMILKTGTGSSTGFEYAPPASDANLLWTPADRLKFTDVTAGSTTNGTHVQWAADAGVAKGYSDNTFRQGRAITRADVAGMLYEYMSPLGAFGTRATDVAAADREAVGYMLSRSAMSLFSDGTFRGKATVTRAEFAKMLSRATGSTVPKAVGTNLRDVRFGSFNSGHIEWAYKKGLMGATSGGYFEPNRAVTRGEVARALSVLFSNAGGKMAMVDYAYEVNVRSGPGTSYAVLGRVKIDSIVRVVKKDPSGVWAFVKNESFEGWVHTDYLR